MPASSKIIRCMLFLIVASVLCAAVLFALNHGRAGATVAISGKSIDLVAGHEVPEGIWSDGTIMWIVHNDDDILAAYDIATENRISDRDISLANYNADPQGIWSDGNIMWVSDWDDTKLYAYLLSDGSRRENRDIDLSTYNNAPRGVWGHDNTIFVVDKDDSYVYAYMKNGGERQRGREFDLHPDNDNAWGIWGKAVGAVAYVIDTDDSMVYRYSLISGDTTQVRELRLPLGNDRGSGIWSDGDVLWVADMTDDRIYAMYLTGLRISGRDIGITDVSSPIGLWTDGETMWVADAGPSDAGKLIAYDVGSRQRDDSWDIQLANGNDNPVAMWSNGTIIWVADDNSSGTDYLYAYRLTQTDDPHLLIDLQHFIELSSLNTDPVGLTSDGDTIWVADSDDEKLYAYDLLGKHRIWGKDIPLVSENSDPAGIWSDGEFVWVMDIEDLNVYVYNLDTGDREIDLEFRPVPANEDLGAGITGHQDRIWLLDTDDEKLFAYRKVNTPPTFNRSSARFEIHYSLDGDSFVGIAPRAIDREGDALTYFLSGTGADEFTVDSETREIRTAAGTTDFTGGDEYVLTLSVTDHKKGLNKTDNTQDDAINITIAVNRNADPEILTAQDAVFDANENVGENAVLADLDIVDLDNDSLDFELTATPENPFRIVGSEIKLKVGHSLDYEAVQEYSVTLLARDNKDVDGIADSRWDFTYNFSIQVNNVQERGEVLLSTAQPVVGAVVVATLTDPDIVNLQDGKKVRWLVASSITRDSSIWETMANVETTGTTFEYTPVVEDIGRYLRFNANYWDQQNDSASYTESAISENQILPEPGSNLPPVFDDGSSVTLEVPEDAATGANVGDEVSAMDDNGDTLTYGLVGADSSKFGISSTSGQITVLNDGVLDYESRDSYGAQVRVRDGKDVDGIPETGEVWDTYIQVTIKVTNVEEAGTVELSSNEPMVEEAVTASLTDPDGSITNLIWQWQTADTAESETWADITGATLASYIPSVSDAGKHLRAQASYDDGEGTGKQAAAVSSGAVTRPANEPPTFDEGLTTTRSLQENADSGVRVGAVVSATDPEDDPLIYSIAAGSDSASFSINPSSGRLEVASGAQLDYESDRSLEVELQVSDGKDAAHNQDDSVDATIVVTIELINVDEPGRVSLSTGEPQVNTPVRATLTDPDVVNNTDWHWEKSQDGASNWTEIPGSSSNTYTPSSDDVGMYLRAVAEYTDGEGSGKSAERISNDTVAREELESRPTPQLNPLQRNTPENDVATDCKDDYSAGLIAYCKVNGFAVVRVEHDGAYTIDWNMWDANNAGVTGYTVTSTQLLYRMYYDDNGKVSDADRANIYESCEFVSDAWACQGPARINEFEDWNGNPLRPRELVNNRPITDWGSALQSPGRHVSQETFVRWSGDPTDPNNQPETVSLRVTTFEMDLYHFTIYEGSNRVGQKTVVVSGANGFD